MKSTSGLRCWGATACATTFLRVQLEDSLPDDREADATLLQLALPLHAALAGELSTAGQHLQQLVLPFLWEQQKNWPSCWWPSRLHGRPSWGPTLSSRAPGRCTTSDSSSWTG